jgi:hypothetical protein
LTSDNWRKSSYSGGSGGQCVEVGTWRKSTYSSGQGGQCVEVASASSFVAIRDAKDQGAGPVLRITAAAWTTFTDGLK